MKYVLGLLACCVLSSWSSVKAQEVATRQLVSRMELHPIQTLLLSDEQFLNGDEVGAKPVTVAGQLRIAQGTGRLPVVVILHGGSGIDARGDTWSSQFNEMGVSTFVIDGFTGRGFRSLGITSLGTEKTLARGNSIVDAYRALDILAKHPRVDSSRIALMGFSFGGHATLYASVKRFHQLWNKSGIDFVAYVPFYPPCTTTYLTDGDVVDRPIRIFHGTPDDTAPIAPCKAYVERLRGAGRDIQLTEYPSAQHAFDNPLSSPTPTFAGDVRTARRCVVREEPKGHLITEATRKPLTNDDTCFDLGVHTGYDPVATRAAHQAVGDLLRAVFRLP